MALNKHLPNAPKPKKKSSLGRGCILLVGVLTAIFTGLIIYGRMNRYEPPAGGVPIPRRELATRKAAPAPIEEEGPVAGQAQFEVADNLVRTKGGSGNTEDAVKIAKLFYAEYRANHEARVKSRLSDEPSMGGEPFIAYCQLTDDACVILTNFPKLSDLKQNEQLESARAAWISANIVAQKVIGETDRRLVVALRGVLLYHVVIEGTFDSPGQPLGGIELINDKATQNRKMLYPHFAPAPEPAQESIPAPEPVEEQL